MNVRREPVESLTEVSEFDFADSLGDDRDDGRNDPEEYPGEAATTVPDESNEADAAEQAAEVPVDDDDERE